MRSILTAALATAVFLFAATIAGMGMFGMGSMAGMDMQHGPATDCVEHCLAAVPDADAPAALIAAAVVLMAIAVLRAHGAVARVTVLPSRERWRDAFGRLLLRQSLATVILRN